MTLQTKEQRRSCLIAVLAGGVIMGLALGTRHTQGLFLLPVTLEHHWPRESFGFAIAIQNLVWGLAQPFAGMIADRFGSVKVVVGGIVVFALGLSLMTVSATPAQFTLSAGVLIGIGLSGTTFGAVYGALSRIVPPAQSGWALGLAGAVGGIVQFFMVPGAQKLIAGFGWSNALLVLAGIVAASLLIAHKLLDRQLPAQFPADAQQTLKEALAEAFRHKGFWLLNLGFLACGFQLAFIAVHMPAYLADKGMTAGSGVTALAIIALTNVIGTYYCGFFGGLYRRKYLLVGLYFVRALAMLLFVMLPLTTTSLYLFSAIMGLLWLGTAPLTNGLVSQVFGVKYISTLFGFVFLGHQAGGFLGVWLGSYAFDTTGSYNAVWAVGIALGVAAGLLHWPINDAPVTSVSTTALTA